MRIRKRKMLFPQSSLPDPLVQFPEPSTQGTKSAHMHLHQPSHQQNQDCCLVMEMQGKEEDKKDTNDTKNESIYAAETVTWVQPEPADSSYSLGKEFSSWKKRSGSFDSTKSKMNTKINKKSVHATEDKDGAKKKASRSGVLMEGSRCSRVNGRGWRCSQPTLVGYSLCEHHLGKGRLRSMNTVKGRFLIGSTTKQESAELMSSTMKDKIPKNDDEDEDEDEEPLIVTKKKIKLGMVKAKLISSLLGQTDHSAVEADNVNK